MCVQVESLVGRTQLTGLAMGDDHTMFLDHTGECQQAVEDHAPLSTLPLPPSLPPMLLPPSLPPTLLPPSLSPSLLPPTLPPSLPLLRSLPLLVL